MAFYILLRSLWMVLPFLAVVASAAQAPNVLFIVVDDLRPSLGCYGETIMKTKNIDNLASKSVLFEQAFAQQAFCGPSRASFLTSRRPDSTRVYNLFSYWRVTGGNYTTLPQHFKENGYITQSVGKVFHPGRASNFTDDSKYSWTNTPYHPPSEQYRMAKNCPFPNGTLGMNIVCPVDVDKMPGKTLPDIESADFAVQFLKNMSSEAADQPFFLAVGFHKPHVPLKYPREFKDLYPLSEIKLAPYRTYPPRMPLVAWNPWTDVRSRDDVKQLNVSFPFGPLPDDFSKLMRQSYFAATSYMDTQVGRVLAALDQSGFANNTIITFIGDHGWALGERQEWSKYSVYNVATRVPFIMYIPGITHPKVTSDENIFPYFDPFEEHSTGTNSDFHLHNENYFKDIVKQSLISLNGYLTPSSELRGSLQFHKNVRNVDSGKKEQKNVLNGYRTSALVELVDLFPTLADAAGLPLLPPCPVKSFKVEFCTEGYSLMPLIKNITSKHNGKNNAQNSQSLSANTKKVVENNGEFDDFVKYVNADKHSFESSSFGSQKMKSESILTMEIDEDSDMGNHNKQENLWQKKRNLEEINKLTILADQCDNSTRILSKFNMEENIDWNKAAFSQFPRPSVVPLVDSDKPKIKDIKIMGYSMLTTQFHYIEWVGFDHVTYKINWKDIYARELYLRDTDPLEVANMAIFERCYPLVDVLSKMLHKGWRYSGK